MGRTPAAILLAALLILSGLAGLGAAASGAPRSPPPAASHPPTSAWQNASAVVQGTIPQDAVATYDPSIPAVLGVTPNPSTGTVTTFTYRAGLFTNLSPARSPPSTGVLLYDVALAAPVLLVQNHSGIGLWRYASGNWTLVPATPAPDPRSGQVWTSAYDALDQEIVLLLEGGYTWTERAGSWTNLTSTQGSRINGSADSGVLNLAYDSTDEVVVFFGNSTLPAPGNVSGSGATWIFTAGNWTELCGSCAPFATDPFSVTNDPADDGLLVFGGNGSEDANTTWEYHGGEWTPVLGGASPGPRTGAAFVDDLADGYPILFGGTALVFPWNSYSECWWWGGPGLAHFRIGFHVVPSNGGVVRWNGVPHANNSTTLVTLGSYPLEFVPAGPTPSSAPSGISWYRVANWSVSAGLAAVGQTVFVNSTGGEVFLNLTPYPVVSVSSGGCGPAIVNGTDLPSPSVINLIAGETYPLNATTCTAAQFDGWDVGGGIAVANVTAANTTLTVLSNGTLRAAYSGVGSGPALGAFSAAPDPVVFGGTSAITVEALAGEPPYTYAYSGLPPGCGSANASVLNCTPTRLGSYYVSVTVTDVLGSSVTAQLTLRVEEAIPPPSVGAFLLSAGPIVLGQSTTLEVYVDGGAPPFQYYYNGLPPGCGTHDTGNLTCLPKATGLYHVTVTLADAKGRLASATLTLLVQPSGSWIAQAAADPLVWTLAGVGGGLLVGIVAGRRWATRASRTAVGSAGTPPRDPEVQSDMTRG